MKAYEFEVEVEEGAIVIYQTRTEGMTGTDESIEIHPDQVDMLIEWLQKAKSSIEG